MKSESKKFHSLVNLRTDSVTTKKVNKLRHLREQLKTLKAIETGLVNDIKAYLGDSQVLMDTHGDPMVTFKTETAYKLDTKQLKDEYPEVYTECSHSTVGRKFILVKRDKKS